MSLVGCVTFISPDATLTPEDAEGFLRISPTIALRTIHPVSLFIDFRGLKVDQPLFKKNTALKIRSLFLHSSHLKKESNKFRIGYGSTAAAALIDSHFQKGINAPICKEMICFLLDPFGRNQKPSPIDVSLFRSLGIYTLADLYPLPIECFASRFGKKGIEFILSVKNATNSAGSTEPWPLFIPSEKIIESVLYSLDQPLPVQLDSLLFALKEILHRISNRLRMRERRAFRLKIIVKYESNKKSEIELRFNQPQGSTNGMLPYLREYISQWLQKNQKEHSNEYGNGILGLSIEVTEMAPGNGAQRDFFHKHDLQLENWDSLYSRITQKTHSRALFQARILDKHLPENNWEPCKPKFLSTFEPLDSGGTIYRPTRLLKKSIPIRIKDNSLYFTDAKETIIKPIEILQWFGPERICEGWWDFTHLNSEPNRDYYRIICHSGSQLWIYLDRSSNEYYLQGYFD